MEQIIGSLLCSSGRVPSQSSGPGPIESAGQVVVNERLLLRLKRIDSDRPALTGILNLMRNTLVEKVPDNPN